jgi:threonine/homoserine/homoserine lactone efflux protein
LGIVPHLALAATGLASLLHASPVAFRAIKYAGVAYLIYMAVMNWRDRSVLEVDEVSEMPAQRIIRHAVVINLLNPKLTVFFFAFLPQFTRDSGNQFLQMVGLGLIFMVITFIVFACYGLLAAGIRRRIARRPRNVIDVRRAFAVTFIALSLKLATS